jgi:hypothetical protein
MGQLITVGRKLAVLGVDIDNPLGAWHIVQPGSYTVPQVGDAGKTIGRSLCNMHVVTNGYAADFKPAVGSMCPKCGERL